MTDDFGLPKGPNSQFWFGADVAGRDLFVRTMYGARHLAARRPRRVRASPCSSARVIGLLAGFFGRWTDTTLSAAPTSCSPCRSC